MRQCKRCGEQIPEDAHGTRSYCPDGCATECMGCGETFLNTGRREQLYCSRDCATESRRTIELCGACNQPFLANRNRGAYCSNLCRGVAKRQRCVVCNGRHRSNCDTTKPGVTITTPQATVTLLRAACHECGDWFLSANQSRICSDRCRSRRYYRAARPRIGIASREVACAECGKPGQAWRSRGNDRRWFCSERCGRDFGARVGRHRRRAKAGERVAYGRAEIFKRDKNTCQLCRRRLRMSKRWTLDWRKRQSRGLSAPDPLAPVLDHIVPLAGGGDDAPWNVQAACFECNSKKGAGSLGSQLYMTLAHTGYGIEGLCAQPKTALSPTKQPGASFRHGGLGVNEIRRAGLCSGADAGAIPATSI